MLRVPVALPASAGAKTTNRSQCVPGAMTPFQLRSEERRVGEKGKWWVAVTVPNKTPVVPVLVICTVWAALVAPTVTEPNDRLVGETETAVTGAVPVPATLDGNTLPAAPMLRVPVALPASAGAKTTNRSQCVPGAMTPFQL